VVNFKKVRFALVVEHDVKAENLKEHRVLKVVDLKLFVYICKTGLA
jgi:hypothetical protein